MYSIIFNLMARCADCVYTILSHDHLENRDMKEREISSEFLL